ncbi:MAG: DNA (cytosine-5-)-methyltransferase [Candidatus Nanoarchaeia archaeon]|nr:DNA (cytosine-5-)-methyltransferase [Candidatus Nanoarchaeia archaeon]
MIYYLEDVYKASSKKLFNVISLFAGCGGSSTGYKLAGGNILAINEFIKNAYDVYKKNYPDTKIFIDDIRKLTGNKIIKKIGIQKGSLDILDGSPPCASFSTSGKIDKLWGKEKKYSDTIQRTDDLFFEFIRIANEIQPKVIVCENVKGLTIGKSKYILGSNLSLFKDNNTIINNFNKIGYKVMYKVLNAKYFNTPQNRSRIIIIGVRNDINKKITFPKGNKKIITLKEAFSTIENTEADLLEVNIEKYSIYKRLCALKYGEDYKERFNLKKCSPYLPAKTLVAMASNIGAASICHWDNRKFTVKEAIRIMGFPDDYYLGEDYKNKIERLGRAVPPLLMKAIAENIYNTILK